MTEQTSGWLCPRCGASNAPHMHRCDCAPGYAPRPATTAPPQTPLDASRMPICGCPIGTACHNTDCPQRLIVTVRTGFISSTAQ